MSFGNFKKNKESSGELADKKSDQLEVSSDTKSNLGSKNLAKGSASNPASFSVFINQGTKINGVLSFEGPAYVDAVVQGEIVAYDKLELGPQAEISAKISGSEIIVAGQVEGDIIASTRLVLKASARVVGNVQAQSLILEEGAHFEGHCSMGANAVKAESSIDSKNAGSAKVTSLPASGSRALSA